MSKITTVVELYGGPSAGKSTMAAQLFAEAKLRMKSVELCREWVKGWAWEGRQIKGPYDSLYIFAKQLKQESTIYGKVDLAITDSPLGLAPVYEQLYQPGETLMTQLYANFVAAQLREGKVRHVKLLLNRNKPYVHEGRYETESQARCVDEMCARVHPNATRIDGLSDAIRILQSEGLL